MANEQKRGPAMLFSMQVSTVIYEHFKRSSRYLRVHFGLRYNAFTILLCLLEAQRPAAVAELADYLMLSKNTVLSLLLALEDDGLVAKTGRPNDNRFMECTLTDEGVGLVRKASRDVSDMLANTFLASLPMDEFARFSDIDSATRVLRGHDVPGFGATAPGTASIDSREYLFPSGHFVEWHVLVNRWKACLRRHSPLSFDEFRILDLVSSREGMTLGEVAEGLQLQKSGLSIYKSRLEESGLLQCRPDPFDGRRTVVRCTAESARMVAELRTRLDEVTRAGHVGLSETDAIVLDAWYMRMYSNMRTTASE
jgi:DNA-binding MarR family transcriptional regulator